MTGKHPNYGVSSGLLPAELAAPGNACTGTGSRASVAVLGIPGSPFIMRIIPVMPARGQDMAAKLASHEESGCKRPPWSSEIYLRDTVGGREHASVKDITVLMAFNG